MSDEKGSYDPLSVIDSYTRMASEEDASEKKPSLRAEIPREFIKSYLKPSDVVLDAGGGTGINAIMMAQIGVQVTLLDLTPEILKLAEGNIEAAGLSGPVQLVQGDITDLRCFHDGRFTFLVCVGDSLSYVLDSREQALSELIRVVRPGSILVIGCDSKYGFLRRELSVGDLEEALEIERTNRTYCGMGPRTHLYTVEEMTGLLEGHGCEILEVASTPTLSDTFDQSIYFGEHWEELKNLELSLCTKPELLGVGEHLLFIAKKY